MEHSATHRCSNKAANLAIGVVTVRGITTSKVTWEVGLAREVQLSNCIFSPVDTTPNSLTAAAGKIGEKRGNEKTAAYNIRAISDCSPATFTYMHEKAHTELLC